MKAAWPWAVAAALVVPAWLLFLNLRERDLYDPGRLEPVDEEKAAREDLYLRQKLVPETWEHPCGNGAACVHPIEVVETRRRLTLDDTDGWYRLFWAGTEVYHYEELVHLAGAMQNPTARNPRGRWTVRFRPGRPDKPCPKDRPCGEIPGEIRLDYELFTSPDPIPDAFVEWDTQRLYHTASAFAYQNQDLRLPPILHYGWRTSLPPLPRQACPCCD
jgi:hypothetical protein